jgi:hypothetical protein
VAIIHDATVVPSKLELLTSWVGSDLDRVGAYRFDDPAGQVGIETHLMRTPDGRLLHLPTTYRDAPLAGADAALVGTVEHSVLGPRWVYAGTADPVYASALATAILTGGHEAEMRWASGDRPVPEPSVRVTGSGLDPDPVTVESVEAHDTADATVLVCRPDLRLIVRRVLDGSVTDASGPQLSGVWPGHDVPEILAMVAPAS